MLRSFNLISPSQLLTQCSAARSGPPSRIKLPLPLVFLCLAVQSSNLPVYFGDAGSAAVLHLVGAERAACAVIALDTPAANYRAVYTLKKHYPNVSSSPSRVGSGLSCMDGCRVTLLV